MSTVNITTIQEQRCPSTEQNCSREVVRQVRRSCKGSSSTSIMPAWRVFGSRFLITSLERATQTNPATEQLKKPEGRGEEPPLAQPAGGTPNRRCDCGRSTKARCTCGHPYASPPSCSSVPVQNINRRDRAGREHLTLDSMMLH
jgi:hypothetical protein